MPAAVPAHATLPVPYSIKRHGISLANCDDEPVHAPGCIQGHGLLLALRLADLVVTQVSDNCARWTGLPPEQVLGRPVARVVGSAAAQRIQALLQTEVLAQNPCYALTARLPAPPGLPETPTRPDDRPPMDFTVHSADGVLLLELEPSSRAPPAMGQDGDYFSMVKKTIARLKSTQTLAEFCDVVAREARSITGLDRAMVYQFHADDSGEVRADAQRSDLPSWQGLRYPAADIPRPARELFKRIGVRPLPDAQGALCEMLPLLNPDTGRPLDMTHCALRGASVMYTEYLQNMGVAATLTMPILCGGALWGLIACHHHTPKAMPYPMRSAAEFLAQIASLEILQAELREHLHYQSRIDAVHLALLSHAAADGQLLLTRAASPGLLDGIRADGVAIFQRGRWQTAGATPTEQQLKPLADWLRQTIDQTHDGLQVLATDALGAAYLPAAEWAGVASGVLALAVSQQPDSALIAWFRGEQVQTFRWAGNPNDKPGAAGPSGQFGLRLTPRRSFELWQELVRGRSAPWLRVEVAAAQSLRRLVRDLVVQQAERLALANAELASSNAELDAFAYAASHDLKEPLRGINSYVKKLLADAQAGRVQDTDRLQWLLRLTLRMDTLLDTLLHYSRVGRLALDFIDTDLGPVLVEALEMLGARLIESRVQVRIPRPMPVACCDRLRVREIFSNLISNAVKYNDKSPAWVEIGYITVHDGPDAAPRPASTPQAARRESLFYVRDNGLGIEARDLERVFEIFKRLHPQDAFGGGSGAGLTIARKRVAQHHGQIWLDIGVGVGVGSTFLFHAAR